MKVYTFRILLSYEICSLMFVGSQAVMMKNEISELPLIFLILSCVMVLLANVLCTSPLILFFYVYGEITAQLIEWASMLKDSVSSSIYTEAKLDKVKKYVAALNHVTSMI